MRILSCNLCR